MEIRQGSKRFNCVTFIRDYERVDTPRLWEILGNALAPYDLYVEPEDTDQDLCDVNAAYISSGGAFRVLLDSERVIGMYGLHWENAGVIELRKMYLEPSYKGRGLGKELLRDAIDQARALGFTAMVLETNTCLVEAVGLYRSFGFVEMQRAHLAPRCDLAMCLDLCP
jgi:putative acetyltransferase